MLEVKQRLAEVDGGLWPYNFPEVRADENMICELEKDLGFRLPSSYRDFLLHANGWRGFFQTTDLLGSRELLRGNHRSYFQRVYSGLNTSDWTALGLDPEKVLAIGVNLEDRNVFMLDLASYRENDAPVVWLDGARIEDWPNFEEFFLAMIEYNRLEVEHFEESNQA
jgi:hypothetical protein